MGLLARTSVLLMVSSSACYSPELRDCTVKCVIATDCAADQLCSAGYCVGSTEVDCSTSSATNDAGTSTGGGGGGGGGNGQDAGVADAAVDAPPDAPTHGTLTVNVEGKGSVVVDTVGLCTSAQQSCDFVVPLAATLTARAYGGEDFAFDKWTTPSVCPDVDNSACSFVPQLTTAITAKFRKDD